MGDRWMLNRAGILNVYQYEDEVLHFAGGRLLLRGVNGSGKSTAMNMLLPFLLDGDTRRIDAAGEQAGVLKSWMLTGRDDAQPIGYLWLEVARGDDHLAFGCGIKANRASDSVTTWWWVTSRRPGLDFRLVDGRTPLSAEGLRAALGVDPVFRHEQRAAYRSEVRNRLYGGADLDQHIRLLHIVRNPRVGDRIDRELPDHLHDALPQLSETALLDAAQPLDELEEHRHNVEELRRTATALEALRSVYADYARAELRRRAAHARELAAVAEQASRDARRAESTEQLAGRQRDDARIRTEGLARDEERLRSELASLRDSPAYAEGRDLEDLRGQVTTLQRAVERADGQLDGRRCDEAAAAGAVGLAAQAALDDRRVVGRLLGELTAAAVEAGLSVAAPDLPPIGVVPLPPSSGAEDAEYQPLEAPDSGLRDAPVRAALQQVRAAVVHRRGDLDEVRRELDAVAAAARALDAATVAARAAAEEEVEKERALVQRRRDLEGAISSWSQELVGWIDVHNHHRSEVGLGPAVGVELGADPAGRRSAIVEALASLAIETVDHHARHRARLEARLATEQAAAEEADAVVARLEATSLPAPPAQPWQRPGRGPVLAELIDFRPGVPAEQQAGLEAAMQAAGLLGAEVTADGDLALPDGGLVARASATAERPLSRVLVPSDGLEAGVDRSVILRLLDSISDAPDDLVDGPHTVVTADGSFRLGLLRGRNRKDRAEHIGVTARRAALERLRAEASVAQQRAHAVVAATEAELTVVEGRLAAARALQRAVPAGAEVATREVAAGLAEAELATASRLAVERRRIAVAADSFHAEAVDKTRRLAANLGLSADEEGLRRVGRALEGAEQLSHRSEAQLTVLTRAVAQWADAGGHYRRSAEAASEAVAHLGASRAAHEPAAARLATLEDTIGVAYAEIVAAVSACEREAKVVAAQLGDAREALLALTSDHASAASEAEGRRQAAVARAGECVAVLPRLRRALDVPGLLAAAVAPAAVAAAGLAAAPAVVPAAVAAAGLAAAPLDAAAAVRQPVDETPAGVRILAERLANATAAPGRPDASADSVRQSLRQRRDTLGAGWDAEDRQPHEDLPLWILVTGPEGRLPIDEAVSVVEQRLRDLTALLSAEQDAALRNLLQGLVAREVADKLHAAGDLIARMNRRLDGITTSHGIGVSLRWRRREEITAELAAMIDLLAKPPDLRTAEQDRELRRALSGRLDEARREEPDASYRDLIGTVLDYRSWYEITVLLRRPGRSPERLTRRSALSEGEKKIVCYLPLFAAVAASCDSLAEGVPDAPRFVLLDDAFSKVSEDNHPKLFGLLVELDLDFIATSERLWGTHSTVPQLAITEVIRDAGLGVIVLEHSHWDRVEGIVRT